MAKTATIHVRMDEEVKNDAIEVFDALGLSVAEAVTIYFKQVALKTRIPFELTAEAVPFTANSANATPMSTNGCVYISSIFVISFLTRNTAASGYQTVVVPHPKLSVCQLWICRLVLQTQQTDFEVPMVVQ